MAGRDEEKRNLQFIVNQIKNATKSINVCFSIMYYCWLC